MKKSLLTSVLLIEALLSQTAFKRRRFYTKVKMTRSGGFIITLLILTVSSLFPGCKKDHKKPVDEELHQLGHAVASYTHIENAIADKYDTEVTGYRKQMGYHYLNASLLDDKFELNKPELILYAPYGNDSMKMVAVEYATPIADLNNPPPAPEGFTGSDDKWEINTEFKLWTLHVWVGLENPHGIFTPHNPKLP